MSVTSNPDNKITVKYTPPDPKKNIEANIDITFANPPRVPFGTQTTFPVVRGSSNFDFSALSVRGRNNVGKASNVWRTFHGGNDASAKFMGQGPYVTHVKADKKKSMSFTVVNNYAKEGGRLHFQITIHSNNKYFTSDDPEIPLDPKPVGL